MVRWNRTPKYHVAFVFDFLRVKQRRKASRGTPMADIIFDCPECGHNLEVDEKGAGMTVPCPECTKPITIPFPAIAHASINTKPCPFCGELILTVAKKCKHCGEFLNMTQPRPALPRISHMNPAASTQKKFSPLPVILIVAVILLGGIIMGVGILKPKQPKYETLHTAIGSGDLADVKLHLVRGSDANEAIEDGQLTPLILAIFNGRLDMVQALVNGGADVNAGSASGVTPLAVASSKGHLDIVQFLVGKGANVNAVDSRSETPLMMAALNGQEEVAQFLVDNGANVNAMNVDGLTPMKMAAFKGYHDISLILYRKGGGM